VVVLSTCESGWRDYEDFSWSGVAAALLRAGIPVVVGMQFTISDAAAIAFSGAFYRAIARGLSVDEAVGHGRAAMTNEALLDLDVGLDDGLVPDPGGEGDNFLSDFGLPVLYTRSPQVQSLEKIRDVDTDPLPMTDRFRDWNPGFAAFVGPRKGP
jgi:CHAT domain-containing protein